MRTAIGMAHGAGFLRRYSAKIYLGLLCLAVPAAAFAWLGWQLLLQSQYRVERGRIASDIYTALVVFDHEKAQLRNWSYRQALTQSAGPADRIALLDRLQRQITLVAEKAQTAAALDRQLGKDMAVHSDRQALLAFLDDVLAQLSQAVRGTLYALAASEGARQKLLADIGHELRTTVTVIRGEVQVALRLRSADTAPYRAALDRIVGVSQQMASLIEGLPVLVRDPNSKPLLAPSLIRSAEVVTPALAAAQSLAALHEITLHSTGTVPAVDLHSDPDRLRQVLVCLLDNAVRYSRPGGSVGLQVSAKPAGRVVFEIADQGIGILAADLPSVWDRGWRLPARHKRMQHGHPADRGRSACRGFSDARPAGRRLWPAMGPQRARRSCRGRGFLPATAARTQRRA